MIWCVRSTKECVTTDVSQFLICPSTFLRFQGLYDIVSSHLGRRRPHSLRRVYKNLCPAMIRASIMAVNMWKNSLKNVESDNNKILYETLLDFFLQWNGTYCLNKPCISHQYFALFWHITVTYPSWNSDCHNATIRQTEILVLLDSCVMNTHSVKVLYQQKKIDCPHIFART